MTAGNQVPVVMVVDDDEANLRVFARAFRREFAVVTASSGPRALTLAAAQPPDVAFVDLRMPGMDGAEVLAALRRVRPGLVCYLLTGFGELPETARVLSDGLCEAILAKPWTRDVIRAAVGHHRCDGELAPG